MFFWRLQAISALVIASLWLSARIGKKLHWSAGIASAYVLIQTAAMFQGPWLSYGGEFQARVDQASPQAFIQLFLILSVALWVPTEDFLKGTTVFLFLNSLSVLWNQYGIFNANSMDASVATMMWPAIFLFPAGSYWAQLFLGVCGLSLLLAKGSTAWFALIAQLATYVVFFRRTKAIKFVLATGVVALASVGFEEILNPVDRITMWKTFMGWWRDHTQFFWFGSGGGTFEWLAPAIQARDKNIYLFMHNDYLQALFEFGVVGVSLVATMLGSCVWYARKNQVAILMLVGMGVVGLTQFPLRFFFSAMMCAVVVKFALEKKENEILWPGVQMYRDWFIRSGSASREV